ncbi:hypothetical protein Pmani_030823 [Petrolisthes manimaculis]|uniref:Uncharacterized protein n=1 Tax=Petrolisthes manimaculis TaxID=1843537 RepID=A0AAE1NX07_9EUCA|nr:hypothetical protein Pmani_030823 [Petrolisthes manimaculis]
MVQNNQFANDQAARDHDFRMLQYKMQMEDRRAQLESEREERRAQMELEARKLELELEKYKVDHEPRRPVMSGVIRTAQLLLRVLSTKAEQQRAIRCAHEGLGTSIESKDSDDTTDDNSNFINEDNSNSDEEIWEFNEDEVMKGKEGMVKIKEKAHDAAHNNIKLAQATQ